MFENIVPRKARSKDWQGVLLWVAFQGALDDNSRIIWAVAKRTHAYFLGSSSISLIK